MSRLHEFLVAKTGWAWVLLVLPFAALTASWIYDDELPFTVLSVDPNFARSGDYIVLGATVRRDADRRCSLDLSRRLFTPRGFYIDLKDEAHYAANEIADLEARQPGRLEIAVLVPPGLPPGRYEVVSRLRYTCNPWQWFRPIEGSSVLPFLVVE